MPILGFFYSASAFIEENRDFFLIKIFRFDKARSSLDLDNFDFALESFISILAVLLEES
jgi:hypothetical protein